MEPAFKAKKEFKTRPDSKGRVTLGRLARNVSSYIVHQEPNGRLILDPMVEIPADELWLFKNKEGLRKVKQGLAEAVRGELHSRGSFAKYVKDEK